VVPQSLPAADQAPAQAMRVSWNTHLRPVAPPPHAFGILAQPPAPRGLGPVKMYICIRPGEPSAGVEKLALSVPPAVLRVGLHRSLPSPPRANSCLALEVARRPR